MHTRRAEARCCVQGSRKSSVAELSARTLSACSHTDVRCVCRTLDTVGEPCTYTNVNGMTSVKFETFGEILEEVRTLQLTGPYDAGCVNPKAG